MRREEGIDVRVGAWMNRKDRPRMDEEDGMD